MKSYQKSKEGFQRLIFKFAQKSPMLDFVEWIHIKSHLQSQENDK